MAKHDFKLDAAWQPIEVISADKGFSMVYSGRAQVVENYEQGPCAHFHSSVIVLKKYIRKRKVRMSATRKNIYWRINILVNTVEKNSHMATLLWITSFQSQEGPRRLENLVALVTCNQKSSRTPSEACMDLLYARAESFNYGFFYN